MKALKALVIFMGLLILVGLGLVGYALNRNKAKPAPVAAPVSTDASIPFATRYPLPKGMRLEQSFAAGDRVVLRFSGADGEKLVLFDGHSGQFAGTIELLQEPK